MRKKLYTSASVALLSTGLVGGFAPYAFADQETDGSGGVASGNQVNVPVDIEAELCGNSLAVLGISKAECTEISKVLYASSDEGRSSQETDGSGGVASGNQINIPVDAAVDVCGNSAAVGGISKAECTEIVKKVADSEENSQETDGSGGVASGNQINIPVDVAVDVCGNSIAVLGVSKAECTTVVNAVRDSSGNGDGDGAEQETDGSGGVASGNQVNIPVDAAVDVCGNAVSVLGVAEAECMQQISEEDSGDGDDGKDEDEGDKDEDENGGKDEDEGGKDEDENGGKDEDEGNGGDSGDDQGSEDTPPAADDSKPAGGLPVTGAALGGLVAAAVAALGGGGAAMYFSRKKKAAAAAESAESVED
ncbi:intracellular sulfur oxidation DsrE/DsrF family protein [Spinactinospora alkalitolerans]|uniref:Intracellular sulfur oxidation DsrE/DsrF family protein n=1 Tax=Spinactinospora alkalitolerans TaxID=687207 RepID=A0A852TND5_9ACTN|nr:chaplin [Spinactinospora alkalitolerans]NYE44941.1 intracellular sulfur oxidation DsrE/DsrF family protein [Spinactinospora alkalitolerans]